MNIKEITSNPLTKPRSCVTVKDIVDMHPTYGKIEVAIDAITYIYKENGELSDNSEQLNDLPVECVSMFENYNEDGLWGSWMIIEVATDTIEPPFPSDESKVKKLKDNLRALFKDY